MTTRKSTISRPKKKALRQTIDFEEIPNWQAFENLVADYFKEVQKSEQSIIDVDVQHTGVGSDGGRDILVRFLVTDSIITFERKWVVQCKFYKEAVANKRLADINIPTLVHQYNADGYLLICRDTVTSNVSKMFEDLRANCKMNYSYKIWTGSEFITQLYSLKPQPVIQKFFPEYYKFLQSQARKGE